MQRSIYKERCWNCAGLHAKHRNEAEQESSPKILDARDDESRPLSVEALNTEAAGFILAGSYTNSSSLARIV